MWDLQSLGVAGFGQLFCAQVVVRNSIPLDRTGEGPSFIELSFLATGIRTLWGPDGP